MKCKNYAVFLVLLSLHRPFEAVNVGINYW